MSSSGNIYKSGFIKFSEENTRVIDANALVAKRLSGLTGVLRERKEDAPEQEDVSFDQSIDALTDEGFTAGIDAVTITEPEAPTQEEVQLQYDSLIEQARQEACTIVEQARMEAETIRGKAYEEGYNSGKEEAFTEIEEIKRDFEVNKQELQKEYEALLRDLEPKMVDTITGVYEHVFGNNFYSRRDVMVCLINKALMNIETDEKITINVCREDYDMLVGMKAILFERTNLKTDPEIVQRDDFVKGQAKIETPFGIVDCSIDTELKELRRTLMTLAYEDEG